MNAQRSLEQDQLAQLLQRSGGGDRAAFTELYQRTSAKLYGVCLRMLHDRGAAEEVLQDTFITVWNRADRFDATRASAITWLVTLGRNKAIDRLRKHREEVLDDPARLSQTIDPQPLPAAHAQSSEEYRQLEHCLDGLEPDHRRYVREAFFTGATYNQLAARCDVPLGTMKSWIRRSLLRLRACLEQNP